MKDHPGQWKMALIGAGNVAWHLGHGFAKAGVNISQVISRTQRSSQSLASALRTSHSANLDDFLPDNDFCIICASDDSLSEIAEKTNFGNCLVLHTAGSVPADVLKGRADNYGVLYPLQTFTKNRALDLQHVPFLVEANSPDNLTRTKKLASLISDRVIEAGSEDRLNLHLAAVLAGNFSNHMYTLAEKLLEKQGFNFELLKPLIQETADKALGISPRKAQTGPAVRGNRVIMEKHLEMLGQYPEIRELYRVISESIMKTKSVK